MKKFILALLVCSGTFICCSVSYSQRPCSQPEYRQFDFWLGEWEVYNRKGEKSGDSRISLILNDCVILEEWTSANPSMGIVYAGKSFNMYNNTTGQWQQTWVDNIGGSTEFLRGEAAENQVIFYADHVSTAQGEQYIRRLGFYRLAGDKVRQHSEKSTDGGKTWSTEYDLEYRKKK